MTTTQPTGLSVQPDSWCPAPLRESDWLIDSEQLEPYIHWIGESFDTGFSPRDVLAAVRHAAALQPGDSAEFRFHATHCGHAVILKLALLREAADSFVVSLCTDPDLSEQLDWTIERFYDEMA